MLSALHALGAWLAHAFTAAATALTTPAGMLLAGAAALALLSRALRERRIEIRARSNGDRQ